MKNHTILTNDLEIYMPTAVRGAIKVGCKLLGIVQQTKEIDFPMALRAAKEAWGSDAEIRGEGDDMDDGGVQYLVISEP